MKKLIFSSLIGLALIAFTGCTKNYDAEAEAKCSGDKAKEVATKCSTSSKCGK
jgi:hypothetical protein